MGVLKYWDGEQWLPMANFVVYDLYADLGVLSKRVVDTINMGTFFTSLHFTDSVTPLILLDDPYPELKIWTDLLEEETDTLYMDTFFSDFSMADTVSALLYT